MATGMISIKEFALQSRVLVLLIQALFNYLIPDHDAKVFNPPNVQESNLIDRGVNILFGGLRRWDAVYFLHIAEHGYTYENTLAFFPLFPLLIRITADVILVPLQYFMNHSSILLLSAAAVNICLFTLSADVFYRLSRRVLGSDELARRAAQLYCLNPASIFFTAAYSETTFALVTFYGLLQLENGQIFKSAVAFGLSSLARSNGLVNSAFILYRIVRISTHGIYSAWKHAKSIPSWFTSSIIVVILTGVKCAVYLCICSAPFVAFQWYASTVFCNPSVRTSDLAPNVVTYGNEMGYKMPSAIAAKWCRHPFPFSYFYVQSTHWEVGFMQYYRWKQLPNFVLAAPMIVLCTCAAVHYVRNNLGYCLTLGLIENDRVNHKKLEDPGLLDDRNTAKKSLLLDYHNSCFVYIVHMMFLLIFGVFCMHVQVVTRFIASSSPIFYWFIAIITTPSDQSQSMCHQETTSLHDLIDNGDGTSHVEQSEDGEILNTDTINWNYSTFNKLIVVYFLLYIFVGSAMFSNFLPWT